MRGLFRMLSFLVVAATACAPAAPAGSSAGEPAPPVAVQSLQRSGYSFRFRDDDVAYWEAKHETKGWTLRVYEDGAFGASGDYNKDFAAQTDALVDFFTALGVSPEQASYTELLTVKAMGNSDGKASGCERGICCDAQVVNRELYLWICYP